MTPQSSLFVEFRRLANDCIKQIEKGHLDTASHTLANLRMLVTRLWSIDLDRGFALLQKAEDAFYTAKGWVWMPGCSDNESGCAEDGYWKEPEPTEEQEADERDYRKNPWRHLGISQKDFI